MSTLTIIIAVLATARLTRLVTTDDIFIPVKVRILRIAQRTGGDGRAQWWDDLMGCPWCAGWWLSVATAALLLAAPGIAPYLLAPWALSYAVGTIEMWNDQ